VGKTVLRNRLLRAHGFEVVTVPMHEWSALGGESGGDAFRQRAEYLFLKLGLEHAPSVNAG
jgi:hypothetical protein